MNAGVDSQVVCQTEDDAMNYLIILNHAPYGSGRSYNGLRLAGSLARQDDTTVSVFLMVDAANCAMACQTTPNGYY